MANYLIIGGNGVIGHFVTRQLVAQGARPFVMSRSGETALIADVRDSVETVRGDITDAQGLDQIAKRCGITHIVHLGTVLPAEIDAHPAKGVRVNVEGTANVLDVAKNNGIKRVIIASSKAVYGKAAGPYTHPSYRPMTEDMVPLPYNVYGITKLAAEQLGSWYRKNHGLEVASLRFGATIGPGKIARHGGGYSRYNQLIECPMVGKPFAIESGGDGICDGLYNDDVARGIICALQAPALKHDIYNIAAGTGFSLKQFAAAVKRVYPNAQLSIGDGHGSPTSNTVLDATRAREEFGFVADPDLDHIVANYIATMKTLGMTPSL